MSQEELQFIQAGLIFCPSCDRTEKIELVYVQNMIDERVADVETNIYPVSLLKCHFCGFTFELERVDPRPLCKPMGNR